MAVGFAMSRPRRTKTPWKAPHTGGTDDRGDPAMSRVPEQPACSVLHDVLHVHRHVADLRGIVYDVMMQGPPTNIENPTLPGGIFKLDAKQDRNRTPRV